MKKLIVAAMTAAAAIGVAPAHAATASAGFNVSATLTSFCQVKAGSNTLGLTFTYTSFGAAQTNVAGGAVTFECTRGFGTTPTVAFDTTAGTSSAAGATATGAGEVQGLQYTLAVSAGTVAAGTAASATSTGTATEYTYTLTGGLPGNQAGGGGTAGPVARTMIITY